MLREIQDNPRLKYNPVGFLDDDARKMGRSIHGVPVLGAIDDIGEIPVQFDEILIAIPSANGDEMRRLVEICDRTGKRFRTIPKIGELIEGRISVSAIREVRLEDLVGRQEVRLDQERSAAFSAASGSWSRERGAPSARSWSGRSAVFSPRQWAFSISAS